MFELTLHEYLPNSSHSKLPGLCKTRWVERHTCYAVFHEMYEVLVTFLDAILSPQDYPELASQEGNWNWDTDTRLKAQGLKASLSSFQTIATFIITKNVLDEVKSIASKLQKREQDIYDAYSMISDVIESIDTTRTQFLVHGMKKSLPCQIRLVEKQACKEIEAMFLVSHHISTTKGQLPSP